MKSLPVRKAVGPEGISNCVLKELSQVISPALCGFFNQSFHTGLVPDSFKQAYVSPVHKGGDPSEISNYRPISLLSNLDKAFVYKFKRIVGKPNFSDQFKKIVKRYIRVGYNLDIMRQSACLVLNPITVYSYGFLFNCTTVGQASDSMTALT